MLEWLGSHYAEIVGTLALLVTTTNLSITLYRLRREARAGRSPSPGAIRSGQGVETGGFVPGRAESGTTASR